MDQTSPKPWQEAEFLTEPQIAKVLGRSRNWLHRNRPALEREGFPRIDRLIGLTNARDLKAWIARRRMVADVTKCEPQSARKHALDGINWDAL